MGEDASNGKEDGGWVGDQGGKSGQKPEPCLSLGSPGRTESQCFIRGDGWVGRDGWSLGSGHPCVRLHCLVSGCISSLSLDEAGRARPSRSVHTGCKPWNGRVVWCAGGSGVRRWRGGGRGPRGSEKVPRRRPRGQVVKVRHGLWLGEGGPSLPARECVSVFAS